MGENRKNRLARRIRNGFKKGLLTDEQVSQLLSAGFVFETSTTVKVVCLESGVTYPSIEQAATSVGVSSRSISNCLARSDRATAAGYHWAYADDPDLEAKHAQYRDKPRWASSNTKCSVVCLETGVTYPSMEQAGAEVGVSSRAISGCIARGDGATSGGFHWTYADDPELEEKHAQYRDKPRWASSNTKCSVVCFETGMTYPSMEQAATSVGVSSRSISRCIARGDGATSGGFHWAYADDPDLEAKLDKLKGKPRIIAGTPVVCLETGVIYPSMRKAAAACEIAISTPLVRGDKATSGGFHWAYADDPDLEAKLAKHKGKPRCKRSTKKRPVVCLETGVAYPSITKAARASSVDRAQIGAVAGGKGKTAAGYHWTYADDPDLEVKLAQWKDA